MQKLAKLPLSFVFSLAFVTMVVVTIEHLGKHVVLHNALIDDPAKRGFFILLLYLCWLIYIIAVWPHAHTTREDSNKRPDKTKQASALKGRFEGAIKFLRHNSTQKSTQPVHLSTLPWFLVIGPPRGGKTTLLTEAGLQFILSKTGKPSPETSGSTICDWWVTRESVTLDIPGSYLIDEKQGGARYLWHILLRLLKQHSKTAKIAGIVIPLPLFEIKELTATAKELLFQQLKQTLIEITNLLTDPIPCYLIVTKSDLLPGFSEFFSELGCDELVQPWGITIPTLKPNEKLTAVFEHRFDALIKKINKQLIFRLHQERNVSLRPRIKNFPLQLEELKNMLADSLSTLFPTSESKLLLQGIYLTSAAQEATNGEHLPTLSPYPLPYQALHLAALQPAPSKPFFIKQLLYHCLTHIHDHTKPPILTLRLTLAISSVLFGCIAFFIGKNIYQHNIARTPTVALASPHTKIVTPILPTPSVLVAEITPPAIVASPMKPTVTNIITPEIKTHAVNFSEKQQTVSNALPVNTQSLWQTKSYLEKSLSAGSFSSIDQLYCALNAYLLLENFNDQTLPEITALLQKVLPEDENGVSRSAWISQLAVVAHAPHAAIHLDTQIIAKSRSILIHHNPLLLAYIILKNMHDNDHDVNLRWNTDNSKAILVTGNINQQIPYMYTAAGFSRIMNQDLNDAAVEAQHGNNVLGPISVNFRAPSNDTLTTKLKDVYQRQYVSRWEENLSHLTLSQASNLNALNQVIASFTDNPATLLTPLQIIAMNTHFPAILSLSQNLTAVNNLFPNNGLSANTNVYQALVALKQLHSYLQYIAVAQDQNMTSLSIAIARMQGNNTAGDAIATVLQTAQASTDPLKSWLTQIATQAWGIILQNSASYIESTWETTVMKVFQEKIAERYPLSTDDTDEINLSDFVSFYGNMGTLPAFYHHFLEPFIDTTNKEWHLRAMNGATLPLSPSMLLRLQEVFTLRKAFFPANNDQIALSFTLIPSALKGDLKESFISVQGQKTTFIKADIIASHPLTWPGLQNDHQASVIFTSLHDEAHQELEKGDWAWFKLLAHAETYPLSKKEVLVTFKFNQEMAQYVLYSNNDLSPLYLDNLKYLIIPQHLV